MILSGDRSGRDQMLLLGWDPSNVDLSTCANSLLTMPALSDIHSRRAKGF